MSYASAASSSVWYVPMYSLVRSCHTNAWYLAGATAAAGAASPSPAARRAPSSSPTMARPAAAAAEAAAVPDLARTPLKVERVPLPWRQLRHTLRRTPISLLHCPHRLLPPSSRPSASFSASSAAFSATASEGKL